MKHILTLPDIDSDLLGDLEHQDVLTGALLTGLLKISPSTEAHPRQKSIGWQFERRTSSLSAQDLKLPSLRHLSEPKEDRFWQRERWKFFQQYCFWSHFGVWSGNPCSPIQLFTLVSSDHTINPQYTDSTHVEKSYALSCNSLRHWGQINVRLASYNWASRWIKVVAAISEMNIFICPHQCVHYVAYTVGENRWFDWKRFLATPHCMHATLWHRIKNINLDLQRARVLAILFVKGLSERARARACFSDGYKDWHCARDRIGSKRGLKSEL